MLHSMLAKTHRSTHLPSKLCGAGEAHERPAIRILILTGLVLGITWASSGQTVWAQTPRPTFDPTPTATPEPTPTPGATAEPAPPPGAIPERSGEPEIKVPAYTYTGPVLRGQVINLSTRQPVEGVPVVFVTDGVRLEVLSDENGAYVFEHLGTTIGVLNAVPSQGSGLRPVTSDIALQTREGVETVVNLGVTINGVGTPPLIPTVEVAPAVVETNALMTITVWIENTLAHPILGATVTDWLAGQLLPVNISSSAGNPYFSGNLAVVELGTLDAGSGAMVEIVAQVSGGQTSATALQGKVSFFYREGVAAQALAEANGGLPTVLPVTGVGLPLAGLALLFMVIVVGWLRRRVSGVSPTG